MKRKITKAPWPVLLLIASFLCPTELSLYIAGLRFPPHRVALFILFPIAIMRLFSQKGLKVQGFDIFFILFNVWTVAIYMYHEGGQPGLVYGGSQALESLGGYLVARAWVRNEQDLRATLKVLGWAIFVAALIALPETLFGKIFTHDLLRQLTGYYHPTGVEQRLGLTRAYGVFDHPIHYGTFCATMAAMYWYSERKTLSRFKTAGLLTSATLLGLSSAPLLCLGLQAGMLVWDRVTRGIKGRAAITFLILIGLYIGASLVSTRGPIAIIATSMTLDSWTGFYRLQIWENGMDNVWMHPLTGLGLAEWERPAWMFSSTIDAFWLVIMIRTGLPALLLLVIALILLVRAVIKRGLKNKNTDVRNLARGWTMSLMALSMVATTVHLWNVPFTFFFFFLGTAGWIADPLKARASTKKVASQAHNPKSQRTAPTLIPPRLSDFAPDYPAHPALPQGSYA